MSGWDELSSNFRKYGGAIKGANPNQKKAKDQDLMWLADEQDRDPGQTQGFYARSRQQYSAKQKGDDQKIANREKRIKMKDDFLYAPNSDGKFADQDTLNRIDALRRIAKRKEQASRVMNSKRRIDGREDK